MAMEVVNQGWQDLGFWVFLGFSGSIFWENLDFWVFLKSKFDLKKFFPKKLDFFPQIFLK